MRKLLLFLPLLLTAHAPAQQQPDWITPLAPFAIADNLYYVGSRDLAAYLVTTPQGDILIDSNLESSPPLIRQSVEQLGFHWADIKILLIVHAHYDHAAGSAEIINETHAKFMVMDGDVEAIESGGAKEFGLPNLTYPPAHVDRILHDGNTVQLGGVTLVAHKTPGHTRGCTTWTMRTTQHGVPRNVVIVGGWSVLDNFRLVDAPGRTASYPNIAADFQRTFDVLKALPCDIFLGAHGIYFDMLPKLARANPADPEAVWVDPAGYRKAVAEHEQAFHDILRRQQAGN